MDNLLARASVTGSRGVIRFWTIAVILVLTVLVFRYPSIYQGFIAYIFSAFRDGVQHPHQFPLVGGNPTTTVTHVAQHAHHVVQHAAHAKP